MTTIITTTTSTVKIVANGVGIQGPPGADGSGSTFHNFAFGDSSPATLEVIDAGKTVVSAKVVIEQAFNGVGASIKLGDVSNAESVMAAADNDPAAVGTYETSPGKSWVAATALRLTITPGSGASQGSGVIVIQVES